jgi:hypothetical protein
MSILYPALFLGLVPLCEKGHPSPHKRTLLKVRVEEVQFEGSRVEALGVRWLLGAPTTMPVLVGASPTGSTSNGQPGVEDFKAGSMGEELSAPSGPG